MKYAAGKITNYLEDLSKRVPAPGGGSSAALSVSMAASLVCMVCRFTIGKAGYEKQQKRIKKILAESCGLQKRLIKLIDSDIEAYKNKNIRLAIEVPAEIAESALCLLRFADELSLKGNRNLASDTLMAAILCEAGFTAGLAYVKVNVGSLKKNKTKYNKIKSKLILLSKSVKKIRKKVEEEIG